MDKQLGTNVASGISGINAGYIPDKKTEDPKPFDQPPSTTQEETNGRLLNRAIAVIKEHIDRDHRFTFEQMDIGIEMSLSALPKNDQKKFREAARSYGVPLWQANWSYYRRADEAGTVFSLLLNPGWASGDIYCLSPEVCEQCGKTYTPERFKQRFCSNKCGAEEERIRLKLPTIEEQLKKLKVDEDKVNRAVVADNVLREQHAKQARVMPGA